MLKKNLRKSIKTGLHFFGTDRYKASVFYEILVHNVKELVLVRHQVFESTCVLFKHGGVLRGNAPAFC